VENIAMDAASAPSKLVGVIRPPAEIRAIVDKTAQFVAKNGSDFESKILAKEANNPKFSFMKSESPYFAYYKQKVQDLSSGNEKPQENGDSVKKVLIAKETEEKNKVEKSDSNQQETSAKKPERIDSTSAAESVNILSKVLKSLDLSNKEHKDAFIFPIPASLTPSQLETIHLVAQYTCAYGKSFLASLTTKEYRNPVFDFLKPSNPNFVYYTSMVDAYNKVAKMPTELTTKLDSYKHDIANILSVAVIKSNMRRKLEEEKLKDQQISTSLSVTSKIDWHDFVIVETIDFRNEEEVSEGKSANLPPPTSKHTIPGSVQQTVAEHDEDDMEMEVESSYPAANGGNLNQQAPFEPKMYVDDSTGEEINIVSEDMLQSYQVSTAKTQSVQISGFVDPKSGQEIPLEAASEHMRIETLDPKWAADRAIFLARQSETLFVPGDQVSQNLKRLVAARDPYGSAAAVDQSFEQAQKKPKYDVPLPTPPSIALGSSLLPIPVPLPLPLPPQIQAPVLPKPMMLQPSIAVAQIPPPAPPQLLPPALPGVPFVPPALQAPVVPEPVEELSEEAILQQFTNPFTILIQCPNLPIEYNRLVGQKLSIGDVKATDNIGTIKQKLLDVLQQENLSKSKIQLRNVKGFAKDSQTLASIGVSPGKVLELVLKSRGR
jgi:splicing factor 3A subunit 1